MVATENYVGSPVLRKEDAKLLTGQGTYVDNQTMAGMVWMALVRPPHVHATIDSIDTSAAASMPGVVAVYTAADLEDAFPSSLPMVWPITEDIKIPTHWPLTKDKIRFAGDAVAVVVAETREQAEDAAEAVIGERHGPAGRPRPRGSREGRGRAPRGPRHERRRALDRTAAAATSRSSIRRR